GRTLGQVFVERHDAQGEQIVTAARGRLVPAIDGTSLQLELGDGMIVDSAVDGSVRVMQFAEGRINEDFTAVPPPYRPRGESVRELTLAELLRPPPAVEAGEVTPAERAGEFHGRLARS